MEHIALYRQFRPMTFDEIVEQKGPVTALRQSSITGKIGHAYLFSGQRGTGKTSIAKVFSRAINCEHKVNGNPCNECDICKGIINGSLMDVIEIDAASNNSVDNIRRICEEVNFAPSKAAYKVYIIDEVHMLSTGAFNALLKTLEEPPKHVVFLLATTEPHRIPATIHSRCQRYDFMRISIDSIVGRLRYICEKEGFDATDDALNLIASLSDGAMRDSISLLDQAGSTAADKKITRDTVLQITGTVDDAFLGKMARSLISGDYESIITMSEELANSGRDITRFSVDLAQYFRDLLVVRMMPDPTKLVKVQTSTLSTMYDICQNVAAETLVAFISKLSAMISDLKWTPSVRTTFEITLIQLCGRKVKVEPVPLVVPDFVAKQTAFAKSVSTPDELITSVVAEAASVQNTEAPKAEIIREPAPVAPAQEAVSEEATKEPDNKEIAAQAPVEPATATPVVSVEPVVAPPPFSFMDDLTPPPADDEIEPIPEPIAPIAPVTPVAPTAPITSVEPISDAMSNASPVMSATPEITEAPATAISDMTAEPEAPALDPEDIPMENQLDLFSMPAYPSTAMLDDAEQAKKPSVPIEQAVLDFEAPAAPVSAPIFPDLAIPDEPVVSAPAEPVKPAEPVIPTASSNSAEPAAPAETTKPAGKSLFSNLSASFLDDIDVPSNDEGHEIPVTSYNQEAKEPESAAPFWEPKPVETKREHPKSSLAAAMQGVELPVIKEPVPVQPATQGIDPKADLQIIWESIYSFTMNEDYLMFVSLSSTKLVTNGENAYIIFDNTNSAASLKQLTADPLYRKIRDDIMAVLSEIKHVYVATEKQYAKVLATNNQGKLPTEDSGKSKIDAFLDSAKESGIDIKFGDD